MFVDVYHRLIELAAFTDYRHWHTFFSKVYGTAPSGTPPEIRLLHRDAGSRYIRALLVEIELTIQNFSVLRDNLGDIEEEKLESVLKLFALLAGMPPQLNAMAKEWNRCDITVDPAELSNSAARLLRMGTGACAFHLEKLDGKQRSPSDAAFYRKFYVEQVAIHRQAEAV